MYVEHLLWKLAHWIPKSPYQHKEKGRICKWHPTKEGILFLATRTDYELNLCYLSRHFVSGGMATAEELIYNRLMLFIYKHNILTDDRYGFRDKSQLKWPVKNYYWKHTGILWQTAEHCYVHFLIPLRHMM